MIYPAERFILLNALVLTAIITSLATYKGITIDVWSFLPSFALVSVLLGLGLFYRFIRKNDRISTTLIGLSLFCMYSFFGSVFNHVLLPLNGPLIDETFVKIDAAMGYSWPQWVEFFSHYPVANEILRQAYNLTMAAVLFTILALGFFNTVQKLHGCIVSLIISSLVAIGLWTFFPSAGASAYWTIDPALEEVVKPIVGTAYGQQLNGVILNGMAHISGHNTVGLIGFPSVHTVMVILPIIYTYGMRYVFPVFLIYGIITLPSILLHGGHNLMDVIAGTIIAVLAAMLSKKMVAQWDGGQHKVAAPDQAMQSAE